MRGVIREGCQILCVLGLFLGLLLIDTSITVGAILTLSSVLLFFALDKGIL